MPSALTFARKLKNKHVRLEFLVRRRILNKLTQKVRTEFPYIRLLCLSDEMEPNIRRTSQGWIRTRK